MDKHLKIGTHCVMDGQHYYQLGVTENGRCFKDEEAYLNDWDVVCYVPENGEESDRKGFDAMGEGYTHRQLLELCFGNADFCDALFSMADWQCPDTWIDGLDAEDIEYFYRFVRKGRTVYWNAEDKNAAGCYEVIAAPWDVEEDLALVDFESVACLRGRNGEVLRVGLRELLRVDWMRFLPAE